MPNKFKQLAVMVKGFENPVLPAGGVGPGRKLLLHPDDVEQVTKHVTRDEFKKAASKTKARRDAEKEVKGRQIARDLFEDAQTETAFRRSGLDERMSREEFVDLLDKRNRLLEFIDSTNPNLSEADRRRLVPPIENMVFPEE